MVKNRKPTVKQVTKRWYRGADVPMRVIRRFARQVAESFNPEKILLFGSHAYGKPHEDSDVDILVVLETRNQLDMAVRISVKLDPPFPLDIIVRTPRRFQRRLEEGESFLTEIVSKGKVLYEKGDATLDAQGRSRLDRRDRTQPNKFQHPPAPLGPKGLCADSIHGLRCAPPVATFLGPAGAEELRREDRFQ